MWTQTKFTIMMALVIFQPNMVFSADSTKIKPPTVQGKRLITRIFHTDPSPTIIMLDPTTATPSFPAIYYLSKIPASIPLSSCKIYKRNVTSSARNFCSQIYLTGNGQWGRYYFLSTILPDSKFLYPQNFNFAPGTSCQNHLGSASNVKQLESVVRGGGGGYRQIPDNSTQLGGAPNHPHNPTSCICEQVSSGSTIVVQSDWVPDNTLDINRIQGQYHTTPIEVVCHEYVS